VKQSEKIGFSKESQIFFIVCCDVNLMLAAHSELPSIYYKHITEFLSHNDPNEDPSS
jgi:hypothetical protein